MSFSSFVPNFLRSEPRQLPSTWERFVCVRVPDRLHLAPIGSGALSLVVVSCLVGLPGAIGLTAGGLSALACVITTRATLAFENATGLGGVALLAGSCGFYAILLGGPLLAIVIAVPIILGGFLGVIVASPALAPSSHSRSFWSGSSSSSSGSSWSSSDDTSYYPIFFGDDYSSSSSPTIEYGSFDRLDDSLSGLHQIPGTGDYA